MFDFLMTLLFYLFIVKIAVHLNAFIFVYCANMLVLILLLPLVSFLIGIFFGRYLSVWVSAYFALTSCLLSMLLFCNLVMTGLGYELILRYAVNMGPLRISCFFLYDCLTPMLLLIVTFLSSTLHVDLIDYMGQDPRISRVLAFLSLFIFFMLILVIANNFSEVSVSWKG